MSGSTLPNLTAGAAISDADLFYSTQSGADRKITGAQVKALGGIADVTSTYTSNGAIALTDVLSVLNSAGALAMTLADGSTAVLQLNIHNLGAGTATVTGTIEGGANSVTILGSSNGANLVLRWLPSLSTWIIL